MKLPNLPILGKKDTQEYFLSLVLRSDKASAVVFNKLGTKVNVVGEHIEHFKTPLDDTPDEELLDIIDKSVSIAEKNLPEGVESQKTIFGLPSEWVFEGKIQPRFLDKLKKVSDELGFKPIGFLIIPEAISHLLHKEEGVPLTALLAEFAKVRVNLYLIKSGKILEAKSAALGVSPVKTIENLIKHLGTEGTLPSRIILFDGADESLQQDFISHKWDKSLNFLHMPQVTTLPSNYDARAILSGAAQQMGLEAFDTGLVHSPKATAVALTIDADATLDEEDKTLAEAVSEFGFTGEDVGKKEKKQTAVDENITPPVNIQKPTQEDEIEEIPEEVKYEETANKNLPVKASLLMVSLRNGLSKIKLGRITGSAKSPRKFALIVVPVALLLLFGYFYFFVRQATVTVNVGSRQESISENVTFSESDETSAEDNIINAQFLVVSQDGKESIATTGEKETGEKAKGTVTIFNSDTTGKTIPTGTELSSGDLVFLTDKPVTVASASGDIFSGTEPGKADVTVTAETFGTKYNVSDNTKFTIEGTSSVAAKNDKPFSGGTSKTLKVVSEEDIETLSAKLIKKLEPGARDEILKKAVGGSQVLPNFISVTFSKESYSKDEGDEANEVTLTATVKFEGISYKKDDIKKFATEKFKEQLSDDMTVNSDNLLVSATSLKKSGGDATGRVTVKAGLIPKINQKELINDIKGKSEKDAQARLLKLPDAENVDIKSTFDFIPFIFDRLPISNGKITIVVNQDG